MMPFDAFRAQADMIPYQYAHPRFLYALVRWLRPLSVVEIGTHIGMSAVWLGRALQENGAGVLTCIDSFCWREEPNQEADWNANIDRCGVRDVVRLVKGRSQEATWPEMVNLAYIDANHTYAACWQDCMNAIRLGATCLALNDTVSCEGARRAGEQLRHSLGHKEHGDGGWDFLEVNFDAGLLVCLKREPKPAPIQGDVDPWDKA